MRKDLRDALKRGRLTEGQLRKLIEHEARLLNLPYEEAVRRARRDALEDSAIAMDLRMLVSVLDAQQQQ
ncbi:MAG: hypothetical protein KatS3mg013_1240 [Actinomycetota bacterium]|nr:MAG: hypothetical protein KatS3mg013_1240 [Actinomycetota bacterium]